MWEFLVALVIGLILTAILTAAGRRGPGPAAGFLFFLLIFLLLVWAGGMWIGHTGPGSWGFAWVGFVAVGLIVLLLMAALVPPMQSPEPSDTGRPNHAVAASGMALGVFFWVLILLLAIAIIAYYIAVR